MKIHTVFISYHRLELTKEAIVSYLETVKMPYSWRVVDNGSDEETQVWLAENVRQLGGELTLFDENRYPGFACNHGWALAPEDADLLQRADNDFAFLGGWSNYVERAFKRRRLGQLGLRTNDEELYAVMNVGGNCVIRRELWDAGLRYDERPWPEYEPGYTEDSYLSPRVREMGWVWQRVGQPCIRSLASGDPADPYYQRTHADRRIPL